MADIASWFPPGLTEEQQTEYLAAYDDDPHRSAADAWYDYAAGLSDDAGGAVASVSTGAQSVTYATAGTPYDRATARGDWHLSRARVQSPRMGSRLALLAYADVHGELVDMVLAAEEDEEDSGTIVTAEYPPIGG